MPARSNYPSPLQPVAFASNSLRYNTK
jgi:uncharacterized protein (DUF433 family)